MPPRDPHLHPLLPRLLSVPLPANSLPDANLPRLSPLAGLAPACPENSPRSNISSLATPLGTVLCGVLYCANHYLAYFTLRLRNPWYQERVFNHARWIKTQTPPRVNTQSPLLCQEPS